MSIAFPNESREYREARDALLQQEVDLLRQMEAVEAQRRSLPPGGQGPEDYVFARSGDDGAVTTVRMSQLFGDSDTLMLYHYMFPRDPGDDSPRPLVRRNRCPGNWFNAAAANWLICVCPLPANGGSRSRPVGPQTCPIRPTRRVSSGSP